MKPKHESLIQFKSAYERNGAVRIDLSAFYADPPARDAGQGTDRRLQRKSQRAWGQLRVQGASQGNLPVSLRREAQVADDVLQHCCGVVVALHETVEPIAPKHGGDIDFSIPRACVRPLLKGGSRLVWILELVVSTGQ
jgi:hypothetical protein